MKEDGHLCIDRELWQTAQKLKGLAGLFLSCEESCNLDQDALHGIGKILAEEVKCLEQLREDVCKYHPIIDRED